AGIAVVHRLPDRTRYEYADEVTPTESDNSNDSNDADAESTTQPTQSAAAAAAAQDIPMLDLDGVLSEMTDKSLSGSEIGQVTDAMGTTGFDPGLDKNTSVGSTAPKATTMVFGVSGTGSRFVYVFDRSSSMGGSGGRPLAAAKREMVASIEKLSSQQLFQVIFYNNTPAAFRGNGVTARMLPADEPNVRAAKRFIDAVGPAGGTEHFSAIRMALNLQPDVVFFLSDARVPRLSARQLREIRRRCDSAGASIHTIEFGDDPSPPAITFLRDLAEQNKGQYRYFNVSNL
ncbi:MAG: hypothetical protein AAFP90_16840, partial [Planctomycetota bacterium]